MGQGNRGRYVKLSNIMTTRNKAGKLYTYYRKAGQPLVQLPDLPHDHPDFLIAHAEAKKAAPQRRKPASGTINALIEACQASEAFLSVSDGYRSILRRHFDNIRADYGALPYSGVADRHIKADVHNSTAPGHQMKAWRFLCTFAVDNSLLKSDPSFGVKAPKRPQTDGHPPWTPDDIDRFRARWPIDTAPRRAFELLYWTGARISDAVKVGLGMVDSAGVLIYTQQKTGDPAYTPWTCQLPDYAADMAEDRAMMHKALNFGKGHMTFLATTTGRTRSSAALGTMVREAARDAGVKKSAHGLRKSRAIALAEAGATPHRIAAWTGHHTLQEVEHYTRKVDRRRAVMGTEQKQKLQTPTDQPANTTLKVLK